MNLISKIFFVLLSSTVFGVDPWSLDPRSYDFLKSKIEDKCREVPSGTSCFVDCCKSKLNISSTCPYCQMGDTESELEQELSLVGFKKLQTKVSLNGHCFGNSIIFLKYIFARPQHDLESCSEIISAIASTPDYMRNTHMFSANQPARYFEQSTPPPPGTLWNPTHLNPRAMREFLFVILKRKPEHYVFLHESQVDPSKFDAVAIYATLQKFPNKLLLISYMNKEGMGHSIVVCLDPQKLLVFDSNEGLHQFPNIEALSFIYGRALKGSKLKYIASFSLDEDLNAAKEAP